MGKRMLKGCFSYKQQIPVEILERMNFDNKYNRDYWYEIISASMKGGIDYTTDFNQGGYCTRIIQNQKLLQFEDYKKCARIEFSEGNDETAKRDMFTVKESSIKAIETSFESLEEDEAVAQAYAYLRQSQELLLFEEGVNIKTLLLNALDNIPDAVARLKLLLSSDFYIPNVPMSLKDQVYTILSSENARLMLQAL